MIQQNRFDRAVGPQSTVQIVRESKITMHRDAETAAAAVSSDPDAAVAASAAPSSLDGR